MAGKVTFQHKSAQGEPSGENHHCHCWIPHTIAFTLDVASTWEHHLQGTLDNLIVIPLPQLPLQWIVHHPYSCVISYWINMLGHSVLLAHHVTCLHQTWRFGWRSYYHERWSLLPQKIHTVGKFLNKLFWCWVANHMTSVQFQYN